MEIWLEIVHEQTSVGLENYRLQVVRYATWFIIFLLNINTLLIPLVEWRINMDNNVMTNSDKDALNKAGGEDEYFYIRDVWFWSAIAGKVNIVHFSSPLQREMNIGKAESRRIYFVDSINDDCDHWPPPGQAPARAGRVRTCALSCSPSPPSSSSSSPSPSPSSGASRWSRWGSSL